MAEVGESRHNLEGKLEDMRGNMVDGVALDPLPLTAGEELTILYSGRLADDTSGHQVYLHYGYGPSYQWHGVGDHPMERTGRGWVARLHVGEPGWFNFCFHDQRGNWDNNEGTNWSIEVHNG